MGEDGDEMILREELLVQMLYLNISYICLFLIIYPGGDLSLPLPPFSSIINLFFCSNSRLCS